MYDKNKYGKSSLAFANPPTRSCDIHIIYPEGIDNFFLSSIKRLLLITFEMIDIYFRLVLL